jgi:hypothetical protein
MTNEQFQAFLDRHGANSARWPKRQREHAERLIASDARARAIFDAAWRLDDALARHTKAARADDAAVARVHARLASPLPRQKITLWRLPTVLLDWQFAPAWPRVAALACCAALGFVIGIAGLDRRFDIPGAPFAIASRADLGAIVFEPEPLTGARP